MSAKELIESVENDKASTFEEKLIEMLDEKRDGVISAKYSEMYEAKSDEDESDEDESDDDEKDDEKADDSDE